MLEFINPSNMDSRVLRRAAGILSGGGLVGYPTDTSWSLGCSIHSRLGIDKLKALKGGAAFTPTLTCSDFSQISDFVNLPTTAFRLMKQVLPGPVVFILEPLGALEKKIGIKRPELGVRLPDHPVPAALVDTLGHPIFSITASRKMTQAEWWDWTFAEEFLMEYGSEVEEIAGVDLVLDPGEPLEKYLTTVVSMLDGSPRLIRSGHHLQEDSVLGKLLNS